MTAFERAHAAADRELLAWFKFCDSLGIDDHLAKRLGMAWLRLHMAYFKD